MLTLSSMVSTSPDDLFFFELSNYKWALINILHVMFFENESKLDVLYVPQTDHVM